MNPGARIDAAIEAMRAEAIGREWYDISTAPKDGTHFLAIYGADDDGTYWIVFWNEVWFECVSSGFQIEHATHWMPLPAGPSVTRPQSGGAT